jgi:predicted dehydrogenase
MVNLVERILIVGLGSIGKRHLRLARELFPNSDIRVLRHIDTNEVPEHSNGCLVSMAEALFFSPQISVIATPSAFHIAAAQSLAEAGSHLLIEKPLSNSLDGIVELIETCKKQDLTMMIGYNLRFLPSIQYFRDLLINGTIGKVLSIRCDVGQYLPAWRPGSDYRNCASARQELGGGVLLELSHELDYLRWIFGEISWVNATLSRQSDLDITVEDSAHLVLGFSSFGNNSHLIGTVNLDFIRHDLTRECVVIGEMGSLRWNGLIGEVSIYELGTNEWQVLLNFPQSINESYLAEWHNLLASIRELKTPLVSGLDGLRVVQIIQSARNSDALGGQRVVVDYSC